MSPRPVKSAKTDGQTPTPSGATGRGEVRTKDRQEEAFYLSVAGYTVREIGKMLSIDKDTAAKYVRDETELRRTEDAANRESDKARRIARLQHLSRTAEAAKTIPGSGALGACGKFEEMINKIMGVDAPTKIDLGVDTLLNALNARDDDPS